MSETWDGSYEHDSQFNDSYHEKLRLEPIYETFVCPLTKQVMLDPVTIENGQTFEREAIEKWFKECKDSGRRPMCPLTLKELNSADLNPSIALRNTIEEWTKRNEAAQLDITCRSLTLGSSENDVLDALSSVTDICQNSRSNKHVVWKAELIPMIAEMTKSSSRKVRCKALETLRMVAEENVENKEAIAAGDTVRTIVKFLSHEHSQERDEAVSLLYELSKSESLHEKIGGVSGAILILVGMTSSKSENIAIVDKAEKTLENLEKCENNVRQMAENGRLQPLLTLLLKGSPETQLSMAAFLGELVLSNDVKAFVARTAGSALVDIMRSGSMPAREAALRALNQISSFDASAEILIQLGILPPLVKELFAVGPNQLPMRLKEVSATVLANVVASGANFEAIPLGPDHRTLVSEDIVHNLLHLISNTGPAIECKLLQVLVGLTGSSATVHNIVSAIKSSGATISLIQFVEAPQRDLRAASIKLLHNVSPFMGEELAEAFRETAGQLLSLIRVITDNDSNISEEQAAAVGLLANLPEGDMLLTTRMMEDRVFDAIVSRVIRIRQGVTRGNRFVIPYLEGLVGVLSRLTYILRYTPDAVEVAREMNVAALFTDLIQMSGLDKIQIVSALSLENLSKESGRLTRVPETPDVPCLSIFLCFNKRPDLPGVCRIHRGICSMRESFCLVEGRAVEKLVACLDHANGGLVGAALGALCTLLEDGGDIEQGVMALSEAEGIRPILEVLLENRTEELRRQAVWAVERILRTEEIAYDVSGDQNVGTALVEAFRNGDQRTRQIAERALKHVDKLPNFSGIFQKMG